MRRAAAIGWFVAWMFVGAAWSFSLLSVIGVLTILPTIGATLLLGRAGKRRGGAVGLPGLAVGAGALPLYVAYLNRGGPGMECHANASGGEDCVERLAPLPWLCVGFALVVLGLVLTPALRHLRSRRPPTARANSADATRSDVLLGWLTAWALIGAAWPLAVLGGFGLFTVPLVLLATVVADVAGRGRHGAVGLPCGLVGLGLAVATIAHRDALAWLLVGLGLVAVGLTAFAVAWRISYRRRVGANPQMCTALYTDGHAHDVRQ